MSDRPSVPPPSPGGAVVQALAAERTALRSTERTGGRSPRTLVAQAMRRSRMGTIGVGVTLLLATVAAIGPAVYPSPPYVMNPAAILHPPDLVNFPFGTDQFGRDIMSRTISGLRISFAVALSSVILGALLGVSTGLIAGYRGGWFEAVTQRLWDTLLAFPGALLGIVAATALGSGVTSVIVVAALVSVPAFSRVVRAQALVEKQRDYVTAARCLGGTNGRIVARHVLPNCMAPIFVQAAIAMSHAILLEASLSFLGLGLQPPWPSLGTMLEESRGFFPDAYWFAIAPGLVLVGLLLAINFLSDGLHDLLIPRRR